MRENDEIQRKQIQRRKVHQIGKPKNSIKVIYTDGSPANVPDNLKQYADQYFERFRKMFGIPEENLTKILIIGKPTSKSQLHFISSKNFT